MSIYIFISDIASYIGKSKFDPTKAFERLWKKVDKESISQISDEIMGDIGVLSSQIEELQGSVKKLTRSKEKEIGELILKRDSCHLSLDQFNLSQRSLINKEFSQFNQIIDDHSISPERKKRAIQKELKSLEKTDSDKKIDQQTKKTIEDLLISVSNTTHGIRKEDSSLDRYKKEFGIVHLDTSQQFFKKEIFTGQNDVKYYICGKMDGIQTTNENPCIIEVKNRTRGFFNEIRDYEMTQMQLYMYITGIDNCRLVEDYNSQLNVLDVKKDDFLIDQTITLLKNFIENFNNFLNEPTFVKKDYILATHQSKKKFLEDHILPKEPTECLL
jgi:hypothetical protein